MRRALASLRAAGRSVTLLAPAEPGSVLVGRGPGEAASLLPWERRDVASLLDEAGPSGALAQTLASFELALVCTRNDRLAESLRRLVATVAVQDPTPPGGVHASRWLAQPLEALGVPVVEPPTLTASAEERSAAQPILDALPRGFLAVHPGSGSPRKNWPADRFRALADAVAPREPFLVIEGPADREAVAALGECPRAVLARGLRPRVLGAVLAEAGLYVGNDSGVSHLAAAFGSPTVVLFGPTDPAVWSPVGPRVRVCAAVGFGARPGVR
jgi:ADP-heptose:LPS heptosyltransferase